MPVERQDIAKFCLLSLFIYYLLFKLIYTWTLTNLIRLKIKVKNMRKQNFK